MLMLLISMQGGSLQKELHEAGISATASAFVQNRKKLSWMDFEKVLDVFNSYHPDTKTYKGYRIPSRRQIKTRKTDTFSFKVGFPFPISHEIANCPFYA